MPIDLLLVCGDCKKKHQNYRTSKSKKMKEQNLKLALKKYCKFCRQRTIHNEKIIK